MNLTGIGYFRNLEELSYSDCPIKSLDLRKNTKLKRLYCSDCPLESLNVSGLKELEYISCGYGSLTKLDVSGCSSLKYLDCSDHMITSLNLSGCSSLEILYCSGNQLTTLDLGSCGKLITLGCRDNELTALNIDGLRFLESLNCAGNKISSLNLGGNPNLLLAYESVVPEHEGAELYYYYYKYDEKKDIDTYAMLRLDDKVNITKICPHPWDKGKVTKAATCTANGVMTYTCEICGITKTETIKATGHKAVIDPAVAATTTKEGLTEGSHCSVCGTILKKQTVIPKLKPAAKYSNEWVKGKWYNKDGTQTYKYTMSWKQNSKGYWIEDTKGWYPKNQWQKIDFKWYFSKPMVIWLPTSIARVTG